MSHPLQGKWEIVAVTPFGNLPMVATMEVAEDGATFSGSVFDQKTQKDYPLEQGKINGNAISYVVSYKLGIIPMMFYLEGTFNEADGTCQGIAKAMKMECPYSGKKIA